MIGTVSRNRHLILSFMITVCGLLYIFIYQFKLPFKADVFLYAMLLGLIVMLLFEGHIFITKHFVLFALIVVSSFAGLLYTTMFSQGLREAILFTFFFCLFIMSMVNPMLIKDFTKWIYLASIIVVASSIIHFVFSEWFNGIMSVVLRADAYEQLIWSYSVDNTYAGLSAYTSNTTFSAAIVFGNSFLSFINKNENKIIKNKIVNATLMVLSLFSIMLCSKRGIFVATIISVVVLMFYIYRKNDFFLKFFSVVFLVVVALYILYQINDVVAGFLDRFMTDDFLTGRDTIYESLISDFKMSNILIGRGTASTYAIAGKGAHNIYLQILYDHGVVFSVPYYLFLVYNYYIAFKRKCPISIFVQTMFLVYGLSGNPLYSNMFMMIYLYYVLYAEVYPQIMNHHKLIEKNY